MRFPIIGLFVAMFGAVSLPPVTASAGALALADPVKAQLIAENAAIAPGHTLWTDLHFTIAPGWHIYWRNPGDSGLPTDIAWTVPAGFTAGAIAWPTPARFVVGDIGNYGYAGTADLLVPVTAGPDAKPGGTGHLAAKASWLVCADICIPGNADLALDVPIVAATAAAPAQPDPAVASIFAAARRSLPVDNAAIAAHFSISAHELRLAIPAAALAGIRQPKLSFFPFDGNVIDAAADETSRQTPDGPELVLKRATGPTAAQKPPSTLAGVLVVDSDGSAAHAYTITAAPAAAAVATQEDAGAIAWWQALLLALVGGAILNLMPCVFPILSLKLLGLTDAVHRAEERRHAAAYAAGIVISFAALGGVLLLLREGGAAVGWGFQLQSPIVVGLLAYLLFALGLSLSGVAEIGAGFGGAVGGRFAGHTGWLGAFATGVLATVVATPCTAPFMGAALGFALIAPAPLALLIFIALGVGLAAPVVLVAAVPGLARLLPRPGGWMLWFKQLLAFPMYATVAWLVWVLLQEIAPADVFAALLGLVVVGFAVWAYGRSQSAVRAGARRFGGGVAIAGFATAVAIAVMLMPAAGGSPAATTGAGSLGYESFTPDRLARLEAEHRPVFVNLTAAWCITCLVNERTALDSDAVRHAFAKRRIAMLKGDWTRQDPAITAFLLQFGRSGVPLYLLYDSSGKPTVLPQILTEAEVLDAVGKI